jgi:hypothetical protein
VPAPTPTAWADMCGELVTTARRLAAAGPELLRRAKGPAGAGYPTSSMGPGGRASWVSDPVGDLVARMMDLSADFKAPPPPDPLTAAVGRMFAATSKALAELRKADGARAKALAPPAVTVHQLGAPGCVVHALYGLYAPARARGRCRWCGDWARAHDFADPPASAIRALEDQRVRQAG